MTKPIVLCILDGVGIARPSRKNAVSAAKMPFFRGLLAKYPSTRLSASGESVGLPRGTMGNSEVGHITIGAGRAVDQFLLRFNKENLGRNRALEKFARDIPSGIVHFVGLASDGKVHSSLDDALAVAKIIIRRGKKIVWHFIADGRDVDSRSAMLYVRKIRRTLGRDFIFGSLSGRYYAMDRNNNWDRTKEAFDAIFGAGGAGFYKTRLRREAANMTIDSAIRRSYARNITDEFIRPVRFSSPPVSRDDGVLFFNYRADRARQFLELLVKSRHRRILCFSQYGVPELDKCCPALLPDVPIRNTLGDVLAGNGLTQLRLAETEKYNHVTYFMDAERMMDYPGEKKILVPSPAVATFDLAPEMSAPEITREFLRNIGGFDAVIMNYANGDMVGHTGNMAAAVKSLEVLDLCLSKIVPAVLKLGGAIMITADHGNAEKMSDWRGRKWPAHTTNPVPFVLVSPRRWWSATKGGDGGLCKHGGLANIAATMLKLLGVKPPREMERALF